MVFQFRDEAIEEDLNSTFKSQGQGNPDQYYNLSQTVVPTYAINQIAEGSGLPEQLQTAWDFSTGSNVVSNTTTTVINNAGFWKIDLIATTNDAARASVTDIARVIINDTATSNNIWQWSTVGASGTVPIALAEGHFTVFLRSGDLLQVFAAAASETVNIWYRQVATVNGTLVNPLGYSAA